MPNTEIKSRCLDDPTGQKRLQRRLELRGYAEKRIKGDGNCQFRAIADQVYKNQNLHERVRQEIIKELKSSPNYYKEFTIQFEEYVKNMSNDTVWGDEITLLAAATVYGVKIVVIQSSKMKPSFVVLPRSEKAPDKVIHLSLLIGLHYNSIHLRKGTCTGKKNKEKEKEKNKEEKEKEEKKEEKKKKKEEEKKAKENKNKRENMDKKNKNKFHRQSHFSVGMSVPLEGEEEEVDKLCRRFRLTDFL